MPSTAGDRHRERLAARRAAELRDYDILMSNKDIPFIRRILNPNEYPVIKMGKDDATVQLGTHAYGPEETYKGVHIGGKEWVVPNIVREDDGLLVMRKEGDKLWDREQVARGNAIPFDDAAIAREFARGSWKRLIGSTIPRKPSGAAPAGVMETALRAAQAGTPLSSGITTPGSWLGRY